MGFYNSPRIILDNLVLNLDAGNTKSYAGDVPTPAGTPYGYFAGGFPGPGALSTVERIDYSSDTTACATKGPLSNSVYFSGGTGSLSYGYIAGGYPSGGTTNNRIDYSNDTATAAEKGPLTAVIQYIVAAGNTSYGYFGSGRQSPGGIFTSKVNRLDYSSDASTMLARGPLVASHNYRLVTGNLSYGYWAGGGGNGPPAISSVDRLDYSNDTATAVAKGPLSETRYKGSATGNGDYGYYAGGMPSPYKSSIDRLDYSNDTATAASGKGPLTVGTVNMHDSATGTDDYGYWAGGYKGYALISLVQRIDYSSDTSTASPKGDLSVAKRCVSAVGSRAYGFPTTGAPATRSVTVTRGTPYGYAGGGYYSPPNSGYSNIQRIDYDNDTATSVEKGPLSFGRYSTDATGNTSYGYWTGGYTYPASPNAHSTVDRTDYSSDTTTAVVKGPLSVARYYIGSVGTADYGYVCGGQMSPTTSIIDRVDYSNDTATALVKSKLTDSQRDYLKATGNTSYGYVGSGRQGGSTTSRIDRIDYSNDTADAVAKGPLSQVTQDCGATGNASYGYWAGGQPGPGFFSTVQRNDYSNDTATAVTKGPLSTADGDFSATGDTSYGYWMGIGNPGGGTVLDRTDYSNDTPTVSSRANLALARYSFAGVSSREHALPGPSTIYPWYDTSGKGDDGNNTSGGATYGSAGGGSFTFNGSSNYVSSDDKANLQLGSGNFTLAAWIKPGESPAGTDYGYFGGGYNSGNITTVDRIDYSSDTPTAAAKGPLTQGAYAVSATGNTSYGYFGNYRTPTSNQTTHLDRIDYSSDTPTAVAKGPLASTRYKAAATGNTSYGYWGGGSAPSIISSVDRLDYSNDTSTAAPKGPLSLARREPTATGTTSYGYYGGGSSGGPPYVFGVTTIDRIDYASDTDTAVAKGPFDSGRFYTGASGNASYGYWAGGRIYPGGNKSDVHRIDYSNDTATASPKGPLNATRYGIGGTGNTSYGYFGGGAPGTKTTVDRIDYSNDTPTATAKGPLSQGRAYIGAVSSRINAFPTVAQSDNQGIISYSDSDGNEDATTCQLDVNSTGKIKFSSAAGIVTSTSAPTVDTWSHAAVTRTDNTISLYINGVLENTGITTHTFSDYAKVTIGANRPRSTFYKGDISQVQIYKKALSSDQIQQNFRSLKKRFGL